MARLSATALLLLSLLAVAHCRTLESEDPATTETKTVEGATEVVPAGILRLPSHRRHHHPCHRGLWWAHHRHHGAFGDGHRFHHRAEAELVRDAEPSRTRRAEAEEEEEVKPVAEPDPDHSLTNIDVLDGDDAAVKRWRNEVLWRMFRHGLRHHRRHHHEDEEEEDHEQEDQEGTAGLKRFRRHHHDEDEDEEEEEEKEKNMRKLFHPHADDESDDELEEIVRRFRKAIMRRRFHLHGRFFRHHHHGRHHHAEEEQHEGGGVVTWIKGLMNRF